MRYDLGIGTDGICPVGPDSKVLLDEHVDKEISPEQAFVEAGLCDERYIALVAMEGVGAFKEQRHRERQDKETVKTTEVHHSFNGIGSPSSGVLSAIRAARSQNID